QCRQRKRGMQRGRHWRVKEPKRTQRQPEGLKWKRHHGLGQKGGLNESPERSMAGITLHDPGHQHSPPHNY
ncbi:MAG TPA: hypothetical protein VMJ70_12910, partial [Candidatus Sulfotelmatobacter sp.]|nr:hypothetical protein [Candidatus Sulfotelmatobacter sp.]